MFRRSLQIIGFAILILSTCGCPAAEHTKDPLETVRKTISDGRGIMLDVREQAEWDAGHLADAVLMPLSQIRQGVDHSQLDADKIIYCYCHSGFRVRQAADILAPLGYDVRPLRWGYSELLRAGFKKSAR